MKIVNYNATHLVVDVYGSNDLLTVRTWQPNHIVCVEGPLIGKLKRHKIEMLLTGDG